MSSSSESKKQDKEIIEFPFHSLIGKEVTIEIVNPWNDTVYRSLKATMTTTDDKDFPQLYLMQDSKWVATILENPSPGVTRLFNSEVRARLDIRSPVLTPVYGTGYITPKVVYAVRLNGFYAVGRLDSTILSLMNKYVSSFAVAPEKTVKQA